MTWQPALPHSGREFFSPRQRVGSSLRIDGGWEGARQIPDQSLCVQNSRPAPVWVKILRRHGRPLWYRMVRWNVVAPQRYPTHWHVRDDGWMGASLTLDGPMEIRPDEPLKLRYGLYIHSDMKSGKDIDAEWKKFTKIPAAFSE